MPRVLTAPTGPKGPETSVPRSWALCGPASVNAESPRLRVVVRRCGSPAAPMSAKVGDPTARNTSARLVTAAEAAQLSMEHAPRVWRRVLQWIRLGNVCNGERALGLGVISSEFELFT